MRNKLPVLVLLMVMLYLAAFIWACVTFFGY